MSSLSDEPACQSNCATAEPIGTCRSSGLAIDPVDLTLDAANSAHMDDVSPVRPSTASTGKGASTPAAEGVVVSLAQDIEQVIDGCKQDTEAAARSYYQLLFPPETGKPAGAKPSAAAAGKVPGGKPGTPPPAASPQPIRPIRYPARLPPSMTTLLAKTDEVLEGLREQLRQHSQASVKQLRAQVIRAYRLVEHAPSVAMTALAMHELQSAKQKHVSH